MDRDSVHEFIREVVGPNAEIKDHPKWVGMHCLLSRWTHVGGTDNTPSAGISVTEDNEPSVYNCFTCGKKSLPRLLRELEKYTGEDYRDLISSVESNELFGGSLPEWGSKAPKKVELTVLDAQMYESLYTSAVGHPYLKSRNVSNEVAEYLNLLFDDCDSQGAERILFPVYTPDKGLLGFTGRAIDGEVEPKVRDYHGLPKAFCLLGIHLREPYDKFVVVVEGLFDYAACVAAGLFTVAVMHSGLTEYQAKLLIDLGLPVISFYDDDEAGDKGREALHDALRGYLPISDVKYPRGKKGKLWAKLDKTDPGKLTPAEIRDLVGSAVPYA